MKERGLDESVKERLAADCPWKYTASVSLIGAVLRAEGLAFGHKALREYLRHWRKKVDDTAATTTTRPRRRPASTSSAKAETRRGLVDHFQSGRDRDGLLVVKEGEAVGLGVLTKRAIPDGQSAHVVHSTGLPYAQSNSIFIPASSSSSPSISALQFLNFQTLLLLSIAENCCLGKKV